MATCPDCGANSRTDSTFAVEKILVAKPVGTFSLAGAQMKVSASERLRLSHGKCGWSIVGYVDSGDFIADRVQP